MFESFPSAAEASNEYHALPGEEKLNHLFSGKMDGGKSIPELKSSGPFAAMVTAIKVRIEAIRCSSKFMQQLISYCITFNASERKKTAKCF